MHSRAATLDMSNSSETPGNGAALLRHEKSISNAMPDPGNHAQELLSVCIGSYAYACPGYPRNTNSRPGVWKSSGIAGKSSPRSIAPWTPCMCTWQLNACLPRHQVAEVKTRSRPMEHQTTRRFDMMIGLGMSHDACAYHVPVGL